MAIEPVSTNIHARPRRSTWCSDNLSNASRATGTQLMPATKPKCGVCAAIAPAKANGKAAQEASHWGKARRPQEGEGTQSRHPPRHDEVDRPCRCPRHHDEQERERICGAGVPAAQQRGAAPYVWVEQRELPATELGADQHTQRIILREVISRHDRVTEECRYGEHHDGQAHEDPLGGHAVTRRINFRRRDLVRPDLFRAAHEQRHNVEPGIHLAGKDLGLLSTSQEALSEMSHRDRCFAVAWERTRAAPGIQFGPATIADSG